MNLIEKVVIKDGVNADTTVTINQYTGQVAEINAKIAHPFIPNTRGVAAYSLDAGITPRFSFAGVGDNEMWVYIDGIGIKVDGITTLAPDTAIKVLPNSGSSTYTYSSGDNGKILLITNTSGVTSIVANALADGQSFLVLNNSTSEIEVSGGVPGSGLLFSAIITPTSFYNLYRNGTTVKINSILSEIDTFYNYVFSSLQNINLSAFLETKNAVLEMNYSGAKTATVPVNWPTGKEIGIVNLAPLGSITIILPSGETTRSGYTYLIITPLSKKKLVKGSAGYWYVVTENIE